MHQIRKLHWTERLQRSPYFLGAIIFHVLIGAFLAVKIALHAPPEPYQNIPEAILIPMPALTEIPQDNMTSEEPPSENSSENATKPSEAVAISSPTNAGSPSLMDEVIQNKRIDAEYFLNTKNDIKPGALGSILAETQKEAAKGREKIQEGVNQGRKDFLGHWYSKEESGSGKTAHFTIYAAKLEGLNTRKLIFDEHGQEGGALSNLVKAAESWSRHSMKPKLGSELLNLASEDLIDKAPPFIYFSGSRDFKLTDKEVINLQRYLQVGGAIWADNGLAGNGSRFDIAFRREMKRVMGQVPFEVLPIDHPIFQGSKSLFQITSVPEGMNYRKEVFEVMKLDDEIAVIYTPNNYTDMMRMVFEFPMKFRGNLPVLFEGSASKVPDYPSTSQTLWKERATFFRNFEPESSEQVFRMGVNLMFHLITRWSDRLGI